MSGMGNNTKLQILLVVATIVLFSINHGEFVSAIESPPTEFAPSAVYNHTTKADTNAMQAAYLETIIREIDKLGPGNFTGDPEFSASALKSDVMTIIENVLNDQDYAAYANATKLQDDVEMKLTDAGQEIIGPLLQNVLDKMKADTTPITPAPSEPPHPVLPSTNFFVMIGLLIGAIVLGIVLAILIRRGRKGPGPVPVPGPSPGPNVNQQEKRTE